MQRGLVVLLMLVGGCAEAPAPEPEPAAPESEVPLLEPYRILVWSENALFAYNHPVCLPGEAPYYEIERPDDGTDLVVPGTRTLRLEYAVMGTWSGGLRAGAGLDGGEYEWGPVATSGDAWMEVPVTEEQWEDDAFRWSFAVRPSVDGSGDQPCATGFRTGGFQLVVKGFP